MAVLIKGMRKPENCAECPFDNNCFCTIGNGWKDCPLEEIELHPERERAYTLGELEELRAGDNGLRAVVMISELTDADKQDVSAILDWDFKQNELVAVWGYNAEPYRARDYMKKWIAYPHSGAGGGNEKSEI